MLRAQAALQRAITRIHMSKVYREELPFFSFFCIIVLREKREYEKEVYRSYWDCYRGDGGRYLLSLMSRKMELSLKNKRDYCRIWKYSSIF